MEYRPAFPRIHIGERLKELVSNSERYNNSPTAFGKEVWKDQNVENLRQKVYYLFAKEDFKFRELMACASALDMTVDEFLGEQYSSYLCRDADAKIERDLLANRITALENIVAVLTKIDDRSK